MTALYLSVATRAFRRYSTYPAATLAGLFTNCVFGVIISYVYLALWDQQPDAGGYDSVDAVTYVWIGQAMLMTVMVWGGGATADLSDRIRTGDVALDLYRPVPLIGWYAAQDLGRAAYHLLARGVAPTIVGALLFDIRFPDSVAAWFGFAVSVPLAVMVSFAVRFLVASTAFWLLDATGPATIAFTLDGLLQRLHRAPGHLPGMDPGAGDAVAVGGVPPDPRRHLARAARRAGPWSAASRSRRAGPRCCSASAGWSCARRPARWWSRVAEGVVTSVRGYRDIALMWTRAAMAYPASFWMMAVSGFAIGLLDFVGIWIMFHTIDSLGGWSLSEIAFLYGATGFGLAAADLVVGRIERLGQLIRTGRLDSMFLKPLPLLTQVCADEFALRRFARVFQAVVVLGVACTFVSWTPAKVLVTLSMLVSGSVIFFAVFIGFACIQFWTIDANEVANAFTYGGNTMTQYPLTVFPSEVVTGLTVLIPLAFVNWYPALYVLDKPDPFGFPEWLQFASPVVAAIMMSVALLVWRTGVRHYTSTGS